MKTSLFESLQWIKCRFFGFGHFITQIWFIYHTTNHDYFTEKIPILLFTPSILAFYVILFCLTSIKETPTKTNRCVTHNTPFDLSAVELTTSLHGNSTANQTQFDFSQDKKHTHTHIFRMIIFLGTYTRRKKSTLSKIWNANSFKAFNFECNFYVGLWLYQMYDIQTSPRI